MRIEMNLEESDYMTEMFDAITVANLRWDLVAWEATGYVHPDDKKLHAKHIKAARTLIQYYTGEE